MTVWELLQRFLTALFCGALIGIEREMGKAEVAREVKDGDPRKAPGYNPSGIRTHILIALFGALAAQIDRDLGAAPAFAIAGLAVLGLSVVTIYGLRAWRSGSYGATSSPTILITYSLGVLSVAGAFLLAAAAAVAVTAVLAVKQPLHEFVRALTRKDIAAAIKFGLIAVVLLPLLPNEEFGPLDWPALGGFLAEAGVPREQLEQLALFNPFKLWLFVVIISGVGFAGYVLVRTLGHEKGLTVTGFVGGLASSTAVTIALSQRSSETKGGAGSFVAGIVAANAVMALRILGIVLVVNPALLGRVSMPMLGMAIPAGVGVWVATRREDKDGGDSDIVAGRTPFALAPALKLAALFFAIQVVARVMTVQFGGAGLVVAAALAGSVDVDAITLTVSQQARSENVAPTLAAIAVFTAAAVNMIVKGIAARVLAAKDVYRGVAVWFGAMLAGGGAGLALSAL